jgi:cytochrome P450
MDDTASARKKYSHKLREPHRSLSHLLTENSVLSRLLLVAGHDTTACTMAWLLYEVSRHPEDQQRIRDEIRVARARAKARGDDDLIPSDYDTLAFTNAVIKVGNIVLM